MILLLLDFYYGDRTAVSRLFYFQFKIGKIYPALDVSHIRNLENLRANLLAELACDTTVFYCHF